MSKSNGSQISRKGNAHELDGDEYIKCGPLDVDRVSSVFHAGDAVLARAYTDQYLLRGIVGNSAVSNSNRVVRDADRSMRFCVQAGAEQAAGAAAGLPYRYHIGRLERSCDVYAAALAAISHAVILSRAET